MKKNVVMRVLAGMMVCGMLTGCGGGMQEATSFHVAPTSATQTEAEAPAQVTETKTYDVARPEMETGAVNATEACVEEGIYYEDCWDGGYDCVVQVPYDPYYENTESYAKITENRFLDVRENPLSTFSADVDTASYTNVRRMIYDGYEPEWISPDAVRIEEMLNYFSYDYAQPDGEEPFSVNAHIAKCPWNEDNYLMMLGLQTEAIDFTNAPASNLVFLIDVSGSMYDDDKLPLLQKAFEMLCTNLTSKDRVSIVTYAGSDSIVLQGVRGNDTDTIVNAIEGLRAGGSTNGSAGIRTAYDLAEEYFIEGGNNRVILATDGDLNVGVTDSEGLERLITRKKESGVFLSVLGFGAGNIKDDKMELLADKGNGNYSYIDSLKEAKKVLVEEMGATLVTVAKDVKFQLEFNEDVVASYRQIGYENRAMANEDFDDDTKDAGEIGAGHSVTVLYEISLAGKEDKSVKADEWCKLHIRYKEPTADKSTELVYEIGNRAFEDKISGDIAFAAAVAEFGMILRDSEFKGNATCDSVLDLIDIARVRGDEYKEEFEEIVSLYESML